MRGRFGGGTVAFDELIRFTAAESLVMLKLGDWLWHGIRSRIRLAIL